MKRRLSGRRPSKEQKPSLETADPLLNLPAEGSVKNPIIIGDEDEDGPCSLAQIQQLLGQLKDEGSSATEQTRILSSEKEEKELPEHLLTCGICLTPYSRKTRSPVVGSCGHTICRLCAKTLDYRSCPICRKIGSFLRPAKNYHACDLLEHLNKFGPDDEEEEEGLEAKRAKLLRELNETDESEGEEDADPPLTDREIWTNAELERVRANHQEIMAALGEQLTILRRRLEDVRGE